MRFRLAFVCLCLLAILSGPTAAALASGGSAGDQQYTDPFGSTKTSSQTTSSQAAPTTSAATPASPTTATVATVTGTPTATAATTASAGTGKTLPYTGLNLWTVSGLGLTLLISGLLIRIRSRRA